ncbi:MAG: HEAT repeat domain-containing protein [Planctomycetales bacterium]
MIFRLAVAVLLLIFAAPAAHATSWNPLSLAEVADSADLIVVGTAKVDGETATIRVRKTLKGPRFENAAVSSSLWVKSDVVIRDGMEAVFLLHSIDGTKHRPFHPGCVQPLDRLEQVKRVLEMARNPAPFLSNARQEEIVDLIHTLGALFTSYRIESLEATALQRRGFRFLDGWHETLPWESFDRISVRCTFDPAAEPKLNVEPIGATRENHPLYRHLAQRLRGRANWEAIGRQLPARFAVTLDARLPTTAGAPPRAEVGRERVGDQVVVQAVRQVTAVEAAGYLQKALGSREPEVVLAALSALARRRDTDAVPAVIGLIDHDDDRVAVAAVRFLGWARDERATQALSAALLADADRYRMRFEVARTLSAIADPRAIPALHDAARRGIESATYPIGHFGTEDSFRVLLQAADENPAMRSSAPMGLYWLVRRSNKQTEPWMLDPAQTAAEKLPRWKAWWEANRDTFRLVRTWEEAFEP